MKSSTARRCLRPLKKHEEEEGCSVSIPLNNNGRVNRGKKYIGGDRFIPLRSAMDFDVAHYLLTERPTKKKSTSEQPESPSKAQYRRILADTLMPNRHRILAFNTRPSAPIFFSGGGGGGGIGASSSSSSPTPPKPARKQRHIPRSPDRSLDAPDFMDDFYLNLLDWGCSNLLSIALGDTVYLWDASQGAPSELTTVGDDDGPITSVSWAPDGRHLAVGLNSSNVQLWDCSSDRLVRTLSGMHPSRVSSLAWNGHILTTGSLDGTIVNNDVRVRSHDVQTYRGHQQDVCGLKWSPSGRQLASGANDCLVHIWDLSMASSRSPPGQHQWLHRFDAHTAAVRALAWCPFQSNLLASGGGACDHCIRFWSTQTGSPLNSFDTGSQICALLWNQKRRELLSSHGSPRNQLALWKYPSMAKVAELTAHTSRVLSMSQSPDGWTVATASGDESLRFWHAFGMPEVQKPAAKETTSSGPFSNCSRTQIRFLVKFKMLGCSSSQVFGYV